MSQFRLLKLQEQIKGYIAQLILRGGIKDPRVSNMLVINRVEISKDLKFAKVYVSSFMSEAKTQSGVQGLQSARGFIQSTIAKTLKIRQFPHLTFIADFSTKEGMQLQQKIEQIVEHDRLVAGIPSGTENTLDDTAP